MMSINNVEMNFYRPKAHKWLITVLLLWLRPQSIRFEATVRSVVLAWSVHWTVADISDDDDDDEDDDDLSDEDWTDESDDASINSAEATTSGDERDCLI